MAFYKIKNISPGEPSLKKDTENLPDKTGKTIQTSKHFHS